MGLIRTNPVPLSPCTGGGGGGEEGDLARTRDGQFPSKIASLTDIVFSS